MYKKYQERFMKRLLCTLTVLLFSLIFVSVQAQNNPDEIEKKLTFKTGKITLPGNIAELNLPKELRYLDPKQTVIVIEQMWGNPEGSGEDKLGMIFPASGGPADEKSWGIVLTFEESGYVKDDDAEKINYNDLLKQMRKDIDADNEARKESGYQPIKLVGWAATPRYDKANHKLFWAKELKFGDEKSSTLNYNFRILGRKGVLVLNAVAEMNVLKQIEKDSSKILSSVSFTKGNSYADFDPKSDKVAEYGIAALIVGGTAVAAKAGLLKGLWLAIIAAKKFVIIGLIALGGFLFKLFKK
jgi:uncharacterized membrane-anchored protein